MTAHPESATLLTRTAREYYDLKELDKAVEVAGLVLARQPPVDAAMQRTAWTVTGNAQFDTGRFADAEGAYLQVQSLLAPGDAEAPAINERLAATIYKQGEAKQAAGDTAGAVDDYLRVGRLAPGATIRETAEFDAAMLLVSIKDWPRAIATDGYAGATFASCASMRFRSTPVFRKYGTRAMRFAPSRTQRSTMSATPGRVRLTQAASTRK